MNSTESSITRLQTIIEAMDEVAVAVSGGVDSLTLAAFTHQNSGVSTALYHAVSPAVPQAATARVRKWADRRGWPLHLIDAGEFDDPNYRANPANRCFFCKSNLYQSMAGRAWGTLVSGANMDDLNDWRPGLKAAEIHGVRHPFIEAGIGKQQIRDLARCLGLEEVAELPASPCLSSRIETGLSVEPQDLIAIDRIETGLRLMIDAETIRCRIRHDSMAIELDRESLNNLDGAQVSAIHDIVHQHAPGRPLRIEAYKRGSAFLR